MILLVAMIGAIVLTLRVARRTCAGSRSAPAGAARRETVEVVKVPPGQGV